MKLDVKHGQWNNVQIPKLTSPGNILFCVQYRKVKNKVEPDVLY